MTKTPLFRDLVAFTRRMHSHLIGERDCFYEGATREREDGDVIILEEDQSILEEMDADINTAAELLSRCDLAVLAENDKPMVETQRAS